MTHTPPTPLDLRARYPEFATLANETVQYWLTDAERVVDQSWAALDYPVALIELAAHNMARRGLLPAGDASVPAGVTSFKSGTFSVQIADSVATAAAQGDYQSTSYGQEFEALLRRNRGGTLVTGAGAIPCCSPYWGYPQW